MREAKVSPHSPECGRFRRRFGPTVDRQITGRGGLQLGEDEGNAPNRGRSRTKAEAREAEQHQPMDKFEPEIGFA